MKRAAVVFAIGVAGLGCSTKGNGTAVIVDVWSDLAVPGEIDAVEVTAGDLRYPFVLGQGAGQRGFPIRVALVPAGQRDQHFEVKAVGLLKQRAVVTQVAAVSFVPGVAQEITLFLARVCVDGPECAADSTCENGACVSKATVGKRGTFDPGRAPSPPEPSTQDASAGDVPDAGVEVPDANLDSAAGDVQEPDSGVIDGRVPDGSAPDSGITDGSVPDGPDAGPGAYRVIGAFSAGGVSSGATYRIVGAATSINGTSTSTSWKLVATP